MNNPISGLLNINKPKDITSHDVVARVRRLAGQRRVGHAGTLDPLASGVLLVCLGQATRLIEYLMTGRKQYRATIRFGITTDTLDAEGQIISQSDPSGLNETYLREYLPTFLGEIEQIPPLFSALKRGGQPLYKRARAGETVEIEPRRVNIYALTWVEWQPPNLTLEITCSSGTYIRSLARDLGEVVGVGAHLAGLVRTASGPWPIGEAVPLEQLEAEAGQSELGWQRHLHPLDRAVMHLPRVILSEAEVVRVKQGQQVEVDVEPSATYFAPLGGASHLEDHKLARAYTPQGDFLAILTLIEANAKLWQPKKVFKTK